MERMSRSENTVVRSFSINAATHISELNNEQLLMQLRADGCSNTMHAVNSSIHMHISQSLHRTQPTQQRAARQYMQQKIPGVFCHWLTPRRPWKTRLLPRTVRNNHCRPWFSMNAGPAKHKIYIYILYIYIVVPLIGKLLVNEIACCISL